MRRERIGGAVIAIVGVAVLIVAFLALHHPKSTSTAAGTDTRVVTQTASAPATASSGASTSGTTASSGSATSSHSASASSSAPAAGTSSSRAPGVGTEPLIVLNDTTIVDLAKNAAARFRHGGWTVTSYDENYSNNILSTCAYYDPDVSGAKKAAEALQTQYPTIKRVVARFPQLPSGPVVVVLTTDYSPS